MKRRSPVIRENMYLITDYFHRKKKKLPELIFLCTFRYHLWTRVILANLVKSHHMEKYSPLKWKIKTLDRTVCIFLFERKKICERGIFAGKQGMSGGGKNRPCWFFPSWAPASTLQQAFRKGWILSLISSSATPSELSSPPWMHALVTVFPLACWGRRMLLEVTQILLRFYDLTLASY